MPDPVEIARQVVREEADALRRVAEALGPELPGILQTLLASTQIVVSGLGKSGLIAQKIAATLTSTGSPAVFMHPVEALHGDLGLVSPQHCLVAMSRSGNTEEVIRFVAHFRRLGGPVIGLTQRRESRLAELSRHTIFLPDVPEAGPLSLAPTTSCIMLLAIGDALAMALLQARGLEAEDFAQYHPEGALGRRLLLRAEDLMYTGERLPLVRASDPFDKLLLEMTRKQTATCGASWSACPTRASWTPVPPTPAAAARPMLRAYPFPPFPPRGSPSTASSSCARGRSPAW
jgi:arabinose-5-phosphate isomerase